ncbi:hypothetical protein RCO48_04755 [Peribacillus frigoritolerans]|nr:hypothetical protein [Peribacillus frigoritolerans]
MKSRSDQALELSDEILQNIELSEVPLQTVIQKTLRMARLINDMEAVEWVREELKGFSKDENGYLTTTAWEACKRSNRTYYNEDTDSEKANTQSVSVLEQSIEALKERMKVAYDVNVSVSSASQFNPPLPPGNAQRKTRHSVTNCKLY